MGRGRIRAFRSAAAACLLAGAVLAAGAFAAQPVPRPEPYSPATTPITLPAGAKTAFARPRRSTSSAAPFRAALALSANGSERAALTMTVALAR